MDLQPAIRELKAEQARIEKAIQTLKDLQALRECREEPRPRKPIHFHLHATQSANSVAPLRLQAGSWEYMLPGGLFEATRYLTLDAAKAAAQGLPGGSSIEIVECELTHKILRVGEICEWCQYVGPTECVHAPKNQAEYDAAVIADLSANPTERAEHTK